MLIRGLILNMDAVQPGHVWSSRLTLRWPKAPNVEIPTAKDCLFVKQFDRLYSNGFHGSHILYDENIGSYYGSAYSENTD